jgi:TonB family protein
MEQSIFARDLLRRFRYEDYVGKRLTNRAGDTKTIRMTYASAELSFKLSEVRNLTFGESSGIFNVTTLPSMGSSIGTFGGRVISGGIVNGKATSLVKPAYPPAARAVGASGSVNVQVVIDEEGKVIAATAISGHPLLKQAAEQAARESTFSPGLLWSHSRTHRLPSSGTPGF